MNRIKKDRLLPKILNALEPLIGALILWSAIYFAINNYVDPNWKYNVVIDRMFRSIIVIIIGIGIYRMSASSSEVIEEIAISSGIEKNSMILPLLSRIVRLLVLILMFTLIIAEWGYSINGVVAGLGLGSVAIALAAKDTVSNILAGIIIISEKPFGKGDWILTPDVEGFVEDITFRSSRIRTFADALVTVPNHKLVDQPITNWSKMGRRRITYHVHVRLDSDLDRLQQAMKKMETYLDQHEEIDDRMVMVRFNEIQEGSLSIFLYYFSKTTIWKEHLLIRQETMIALIQILQKEGIQLAYPMQRIVVESSIEKEPVELFNS
ncbi:mechanosensitive ion channel family protein [Paenibacillus sp. T3-5-0-4]|nr:mechanosensitive ion channel family protein [Paenibacillus endoradicis]